MDQISLMLLVDNDYSNSYSIDLIVFLDLTKDLSSIGNIDPDHVVPLFWLCFCR